MLWWRVRFEERICTETKLRRSVFSSTSIRAVFRFNLAIRLHCFLEAIMHRATLWWSTQLFSIKWMIVCPVSMTNESFTINDMNQSFLSAWRWNSSKWQQFCKRFNKKHLSDYKSSEILLFIVSSQFSSRVIPTNWSFFIDLSIKKIVVKL